MMDKKILMVLIAAFAAIVIATVVILFSVKKKKKTAAEVTVEEEPEIPEGEENPEEDEEIPEDELCPCCGERRIFEDGDYCKTCADKLKKTKIPVGGWIAGLIVLLVSVVAMADSFLISAPAIQAAKGNSYAAENSWYNAYTAYGDVDSVITEINGIIGTETSFIKKGCNLKRRQVSAVANAYSPLEAANYIATAFTADDDGFVQRCSELKEYKKELEDFQNTYNAVTEAGGDMLYDGSKIDDVVKAFLSVKGQDGVKSVYVDYFVCNADSFLAPEDTQRALKDYETLEVSENMSGKDYSWLYYQEYAKLCLKAGDTDRAIELMDRIIGKDNGNYSAYLSKMKALIIAGKKDEAEKLIYEFVKHNDAADTEYVLRITYHRYVGEYDKVKALCEEAFEENDFVPELHRQLAIVYLLEKDYDNAYEQAYAAEERAYYLYSMGDSSGYTDELVDTVYICTSLCKKYGTGKSENAAVIDELLESYSQEETSATAKAIVEGKLAPEKVFTEGAYDLI